MTGALPAEVRELLGVVLAAIDIPYPATLGDTARHQEVLAERAMHTTITLRNVLAREGTQFPADLPWETAYLREQSGRPSSGRLQDRALAREAGRVRPAGHPGW